MDRNYRFMYRVIFILGIICFSVWGIKDFSHKREIHRLLQVLPSETIVQVQSSNIDSKKVLNKKEKGTNVTYNNLSATNIENTINTTEGANNINGKEKSIEVKNDRKIYNSSTNVEKKVQSGIKFNSEEYALSDGNEHTLTVVELKDKSSENLDELQLLARLIQSEAGQEQYEGKLAVGNVVLNRARENNKSIENVIYEKNQFDGINTSNFYTSPNEESINAAKEVLNGKQVLEDDSYYFVNLKIASPSWAKEKTFVARIGDHWFFRKE